MSALPKWTEDRTNQLTGLVEGVDVVTQALVAEIAATMETSARSVSSKLRKMDYEVEKASDVAKTKSFTDAQEAALNDLIVNNSGAFTYAELAEAFSDAAGEEFSAKKIQGKVLSMQLTEHIKPTPKKEVAKSYTEEEEVTFVKMANDGAFLEEIAEALGKQLNSVRGKALSLLRSEDISAIPKQKETVSKERVDALAALGDVSEMTVEEIAEKLEKTARGVKTMLTRRGINVADYKGADRKAKAAETK